jgi:hypothetical protein
MYIVYKNILNRRTTPLTNILKSLICFARHNPSTILLSINTAWRWLFIYNAYSTKSMHNKPVYYHDLSTQQVNFRACSKCSLDNCSYYAVILDLKMSNTTNIGGCVIRVRIEKTFSVQTCVLRSSNTWNNQEQMVIV